MGNGVLDQDVLTLSSSTDESGRNKKLYVRVDLSFVLIV